MSYKSRGNYAYRPNPAQCCERCVFGSGEHAEWCLAAESASCRKVSEQAQIAVDASDRLIEAFRREDREAILREVRILKQVVENVKRVRFARMVEGG